MASANALFTNKEGPSYEQMKEYVERQSAIMREINKLTILFGIGIQAEIPTKDEAKSMKLHEHQVHFMNAIANTTTAEKSVSVRGEYIEAACINAGVSNCISLGCPRLV